MCVGGGGGGEGFTSLETAVAISGRSVILTILFLGRLSGHTHMFTCAFLQSVEGKKDRRKDSIISFHECMWPDRVLNPLPIALRYLTNGEGYTQWVK